MDGSVLGHHWNPISSKLKVFLGKNGRCGTHNGLELTLENLQLNETFPWSKALLLSTIASMFDPSGMIAPLILKYKLFLREVCLETEVGWNDTLPETLMVRWRKLVEELVKSPKIVVRKCARPKNAIGPTDSPMEALWLLEQ